jgi:hypothetical protein
MSALPHSDRRKGSRRYDYLKHKYSQRGDESEVDVKNRINEDIHIAEENIKNMKDEYKVFITKYVENKYERDSNYLITIVKSYNTAIDKYNEIYDAIDFPDIKKKQKRHTQIDINSMIKKYPSQVNQYQDFQMLAKDLHELKNFIDGKFNTGEEQFNPSMSLKVIKLKGRLNHYSKGEGIIHDYELFNYESFNLNECLGAIYDYHNNSSGEVGNISECWKHIDNMLKWSYQEIIKVVKKEEEDSREPTKEEKEEKEKEEFEEMKTGLHDLKEFIDGKFKTGEEQFNPESAERVKVLIEQLNKFSRGKFVPFYVESFDLDNDCLETIKNYYFNPPMGRIQNDHEFNFRKENELKLKNCYNNIMNMLIFSQKEINKAKAANANINNYSGSGRRRYKNHSKRKLYTKKIRTNKKNSKKQKSKVASKKKQKSKVSSKKKQKSKTKKNNRRRHKSTLKR